MLHIVLNYIFQKALEVFVSRFVVPRLAFRGSAPVEKEPSGSASPCESPSVAPRGEICGRESLIPSVAGRGDGIVGEVSNG